MSHYVILPSTRCPAGNVSAIGCVIAVVGMPSVSPRPHLLTQKQPPSSFLRKERLTTPCCCFARSSCSSPPHSLAWMATTTRCGTSSRSECPQIFKTSHRNHISVPRERGNRRGSHGISFADLKENQENPIHETNALAELVMPLALILLVSELPDSLSTNIINHVVALSHSWKNQKEPFAVHRMKFILAAVTHT